MIISSLIRQRPHLGTEINEINSLNTNALLYMLQWITTINAIVFGRLISGHKEQESVFGIDAGITYVHASQSCGRRKRARELCYDIPESPIVNTAQQSFKIFIKSSLHSPTDTAGSMSLSLYLGRQICYVF